MARRLDDAEATRAQPSTQFQILDQSGSPVVPEGPPPPQPRRSTHARSQSGPAGSSAVTAPAPTMASRPSGSRPPQGPRVHKLSIVDSDEMLARTRAAAEAEATTQAEEEQSSSSEPEPEVDVDDLRRATPTRIWRLRLRNLERWYSTPRPTEEGTMFWSVLQQRFHLAYIAARMGIFPHRVLVPSVLTRAIDMTREQIEEFLLYQLGLTSF